MFLAQWAPALSSLLPCSKYFVMSQFKERFSVDNWEDDCLSGAVDTPQYTCRCLWIPPSFVRMCLSVQLSFQPLSVWILITLMCLTCVSLPPGVFKPTSPLFLSQIVLRLCGKHLVCPSCLVCWKFELLTDLDFSAVLDWYAASACLKPADCMLNMLCCYSLWESCLSWWFGSETLH